MGQLGVLRRLGRGNHLLFLGSHLGLTLSNLGLQFPDLLPKGGKILGPIPSADGHALGSLLPLQFLSGLVQLLPGPVQFSSQAVQHRLGP